MSSLDQLAAQVRAAGRGFRRPTVQVIPSEDAVTIRVDDRLDGKQWHEIVLTSEVLADLLALSSGIDQYGDQREWDASPEADYALHGDPEPDHDALVSEGW